MMEKNSNNKYLGDMSLLFTIHMFKSLITKVGMLHDSWGLPAWVAPWRRSAPTLVARVVWWYLRQRLFHTDDSAIAKILAWVRPC